VIFFSLYIVVIFRMRNFLNYISYGFSKMLLQFLMGGIRILKRVVKQCCRQNILILNAKIIL